MGKDAEDTSAPKSAVEKPPGTPEMSARETEDMVNSMLRDPPLPDTERSDERLPEDGGSDKLPEEKDGRSFLKEATRNCLRRLLQVNLYHLVLRKYFSLLLIK